MRKKPLGAFLDEAAGRWSAREALTFAGQRWSFVTCGRQSIARPGLCCTWGYSLATGWRSGCRGHLASFKIPQYTVMLDAFPMPSSRKVQQCKLREIAAAQVGAVGAGATAAHPRPS
jgi:acyl-CoA synthetase (AMP-forming)/AMP-acid ligase II